jgi:hypothetical protein
MSQFSSRHGFEAEEAEITVRNDAPYNLRGFVVDIAYEAGLDPHSMRSIVCSTLREREDPGNWSAYPNVDGEVRSHLDTCPWYAVYDIIEATHVASSARRAAAQPIAGRTSSLPRSIRCSARRASDGSS